MVRCVCVCVCRAAADGCPLQGGSKKPETFLVALRGAWAMLSQDIGSVHVNFAQPYSLQVGVV